MNALNNPLHPDAQIISRYTLSDLLRDGEMINVSAALGDLARLPVYATRGLIAQLSRAGEPRGVAQLWILTAQFVPREWNGRPVRFSAPDLDAEVCVSIEGDDDCRPVVILCLQGED
ncbi:hypothetical protein [Deinococcus soli (ex Cha et al. 2016)]|uniref:Uncharacterized protein n=2 Tax=Deinococcus soli (ex Cha et al. 2016) TaxID=1309411 RepID=A0AAE3XEC4_9DEIO|nr:hypothetical protein [Deinococcus soli (ex Cha et al. 2016)]MDR6218158.1 hypothetical protein [Deinococcus soli (ex Cha et al. 2016)]MDR6328898.1 hypothetical protein [Deinococcus soli (ex Cha et al. 2016)]MDR6751614.1 hypothetical protein [Deinococcus soli (ex Cha et al. 2016)]